MVSMLNFCLASLALCREIDDKKLLMKISLEMAKDTLLRSCGIHYKYSVHRSNEKSVSWEFVPKKTTPGDPANRILSVPRDQIQQRTGMCLIIK